MLPEGLRRLPSSHCPFWIISSVAETSKTLQHAPLSLGLAETSNNPLSSCPLCQCDEEKYVGPEARLAFFRLVADAARHCNQIGVQVRAGVAGLHDYVRYVVSDEGVLYLRYIRPYTFGMSLHIYVNPRRSPLSSCCCPTSPRSRRASSGHRRARHPPARPAGALAGHISSTQRWV